MMIKKIISGGQTGVDRAALDIAMEKDIACGGYCPKGRKAEDGFIPLRYPLVETATEEYAERTRLNVEAADGTLILAPGPLAGGTLLTAEHCRQVGKPCLVVDLSTAGVEVAAWISEHRIVTLNIAGPRERESPGIYQQALVLLRRVIS